MKLVSIGDQVETGIYRFHSRFNRAVNFVRDGRLVSVVDKEIGDGPLNIVLQDLAEAPAEGGNSPLEVGAAAIVFQGRTHRFARCQRYESTLACAAGRSPHLDRNLAHFGRLLRRDAPRLSLAFLLDEHRVQTLRPGFEAEFAAHVRQSVDLLFTGSRMAGVRALRGCGVGLTPSGDDFIAGYLIALNLLQATRGVDLRRVTAAVVRAARSDNAYSNTFLEMAGRGLLFGRMKRLVIALLNGDADDVRQSTAALLAIGASSGADLGTGFFLTMQSDLAGVSRAETGRTERPAGAVRFRPSQGPASNARKVAA